MFSSLVAFIFGSNTTATTSSDTNQNPIGQEEQRKREEQVKKPGAIDYANTIQVTSLTPSVTGTSNNSQHFKSGDKNKRNNKNKNNRRKQECLQEGQGRLQNSKLPLKNLQASTDTSDEDFDEDDWFIVEREDLEDTSSSRTDFEEELSAAEAKHKPEIASSTNGSRIINNTAQQQRRRQHIVPHSLYSGPRPHQHRNYLQKARNSGAHRGATINTSELCPPMSIADAGISSLADAGLTQSLYIASAPNQYEEHNVGSANTFGANVSMDESWFITPPPCFTSIGPINVEISPFENLLIEHPSMSVYHSIRSAQEATESFINLDLGVSECESYDNDSTECGYDEAVYTTIAKPEDVRNTQIANEQPRSTRPRIDRCAVAQLKQELLARNSQKQMEKKDRQNLSRAAMDRGNKARQFQSNGRRQRRADMQHCKIISGANNNRKCCF